MQRTQKSTTRKKINYSFRRIYFSLLSGVLFVFVVIGFFALTDNYDKQQSTLEQKNTDQLAQGVINPYLSSEENSALEVLSRNSFGDSFTSDAWLNLDETTMFLDTSVGALIFPPKYTFFKEKTCVSGSANCTQKINYSEACIGNDCLVVNGNSLSLKGENLALPKQLSEKRIKKLAIYAFEKTWLIGAIINFNGQESLALFLFDGTSFSPLIGEGTSLSGQTKFGRANGFLGFGGQEDDFLFLYSGYEGMAYHFKNKIGRDVSEFFGLRVTAGGFLPQVTRVQDEAGIFWYIAGANQTGAHFLKLWQNGTEDLQGIVDLSSIFNSINPQPQSIFITFDLQNETRTLHFLVHNENQKKAEIWRFFDLGFDNSFDRLVVSKNVNEKKYLVRGAVASGLGLNLGFSVNSPLIQLSNNELDWLGTDLDKELSFPDKNGNELFWRIKFQKNNDRDFSPYFSHLNNLGYRYLSR
ncbi:MAG: hypothetical protein ACOYMB_01110 [Patescibacteria group bacterium]